MRLARRLALLLALVPAAGPAEEDPPCPKTGALVALASRYVARVEAQLTAVIGDEVYRQYSYNGPSPLILAQRTLASDVTWVPTRDAMVWAFYRDVRVVDGVPLADRGSRLEALFPGGLTAASNAKALQILDESSRFNLGPRRTVNIPTLALSLLHPLNLERSSFEANGEARRDGVTVCSLQYDERARPTFVRRPDGQDVAAKGEFWIEPRSGAVVGSTIELKAKGHDPVLIETAFRYDPALESWLPSEMSEIYGSRAPRPRGDRIEAVARYSRWRRAHVEMEIVIPKP
jgi:hypothetical protein